jgi:hypothetical protein
MMVLARRVEHALDVAIERPHDADARMHQEVATFGGADQASDGGLPLVELLFGLRKSGDVVSGIFEGDELSTIGQRDRIVERSLPSRRH